MLIEGESFQPIPQFPFPLEEAAWSDGLVELMRNRHLPGTGEQCRTIFEAIYKGYSKLSERVRAGERIFGVPSSEIGPEREEKLRELYPGIRSTLGVKVKGMGNKRMLMEYQLQSDLPSEFDASQGGPKSRVIQ